MAKERGIYALPLARVPLSTWRGRTVRIRVSRNPPWVRAKILDVDKGGLKVAVQGEGFAYIPRRAVLCVKPVHARAPAVWFSDRCAWD